MTQKAHPLGFEIVDGQLHGSLRVGIRIKGHLHKNFVMREALVEDLLAAEEEASVTQPLAFNAQLMTLQLVRVGDFEGPFMLEQLSKLKPADWRTLRAAQSELDLLGEADSASEEVS